MLYIKRSRLKSLLGGWVDGWMAGKARLRIAYSNQKEVREIQLEITRLLQCGFWLIIKFLLLFLAIMSVQRNFSKRRQIYKLVLKSKTPKYLHQIPKSQEGKCLLTAKKTSENQTSLVWYPDYENVLTFNGLVYRQHLKFELKSSNFKWLVDHMKN
jgi:hypothetical protein